MEALTARNRSLLITQDMLMYKKERKKRKLTSRQHSTYQDARADHKLPRGTATNYKTFPAMGEGES